jgi:hypothetical protein
VPIVAYRIEPTGGGDFSVWVRRKSGPTIVAIIFGIALLLPIPIALIYDVVAHPSRAAAHHSRGMPICLWPVLAGVFAVGVWRSILAIIAEFRGLEGNEQWLFTHGQIAPPVDQLGDQLPPMVAALGGIRASLNSTGRKWVIDFSDGARNLYLGPFNSSALARRCEAEFRRLRPGWFPEQPDIAELNGSLGQTRINGYKSLPDPIVSFEPVSVDADRCLLKLRRGGGPPPQIYFVMFWLCAWLAGEIVVAWKLHQNLTALFNHLSPKETISGLCFMLVWFAGWTLFGLLAMWIVVLGLKRTEVWQFTHAEIIAGRSWHWWSRRRLPIDPTVQVRFGPYAGLPSVNFVSAGMMLRLGPFATWELAGKAIGDVQRQFPHWHWPGTGEK